MTPEEIAHYNATASPGDQYRTCSECGRVFWGAGWGGWRKDGDKVYARSGMCSEKCLNADLTSAVLREKYITALYQAAANVDCNKISRMMQAVGWGWGSPAKAPSGIEVHSSLVAMCSRLSEETPQTIGWTYSGGWHYHVYVGEDEDGQWVRVAITWGPSGQSEEDL